MKFSNAFVGRKVSFESQCFAGDVCTDENASCDLSKGSCQCRYAYFQQNNVCGKYLNYWSSFSLKFNHTIIYKLN